MNMIAVTKHEAAQQTKSFFLFHQSIIDDAAPSDKSC